MLESGCPWRSFQATSLLLAFLIFYVFLLWQEKIIVLSHNFIAIRSLVPYLPPSPLDVTCYGPTNVPVQVGQKAAWNCKRLGETGPPFKGDSDDEHG